LSESSEQKELIKWFRVTYPQHYWEFYDNKKKLQKGQLLMASQNGVSRGKAGSKDAAIRTSIAKAEGMVAGANDLQLIMARHGFHGLWIEFKATPPNDSKLTIGEQIFADAVSAQGYMAVVCKGLEAAQDTIRSYLDESTTIN